MSVDRPLCCAVFGCNAWACFGFGQVRGEPDAGLWVCGSALHRAWALGVLEARKRLSLVSERAPTKSVALPKPAPLKPVSLFEDRRQAVVASGRSAGAEHQQSDGSGGQKKPRAPEKLIISPKPAPAKPATLFDEVPA